VLALQARVEEVHAEPAIVDYLMAIVQATRTDARLRAGASTRAAISLFRAARGYALVDGRTFLVPDDVRRLVVPCLAHRLLPAGSSAATTEAYEEAVAVLDAIVADVGVPV
jgi:MoxR-like ATPase